MSNDQHGESHETESENERDSRRSFMKRVGGSLFVVTLVDISDAGIQTANASSGCGPASKAPFGNPDLLCSIALSADENCGVSQLPNKGADMDQLCNVPFTTDPDASCGDCDDKHQSDNHCGVKGDADEMCGHQSNIKGQEDDNCSDKIPDSGCGTHKAVYGVPGSWVDTDQHCVNGNPDNNCTGDAGDALCNAKSMPSTTSPDEGCGPTDQDEACSHYDHDESCSTIGPDEACGTYPMPIPFVGVADPDNACNPAAGDPDNTDDPNEGPIAPYCSAETDPDYWDPPGS